MKRKHFTISRIILIVLILSALIFIGTKGLTISKNTLKNDLPAKYTDIFAPIIVSLNSLDEEDISELSLEMLGADVQEVIAVRIFNTKGILLFEATKEDPKFHTINSTDMLNIRTNIDKLNVLLKDSEWSTSAYQLKTIYDNLRSVSLELSETVDSGMSESSAIIEYDTVLYTMQMCGGMPLTSDLAEKYSEEFALILDGISTMSDVDAITASIDAIDIISADAAAILAEYVTMNSYVPHLPEVYSPKKDKKQGWFEKLMTINAGNEATAPIFIESDLSEEELLSAMWYCDIIFAYKSYDAFQYMPRVYKYLSGGFLILLLLLIFVPAKKEKKDVLSFDDKIDGGE